MKANILRAFSVLACALALAGCEHSYPLVWSPDGNTMALIAEDGLRFGDAEGHLSPATITNANLLAWLPNSNQLLAGTSTHIPTWSEAKPFLSPEQQKASLDLAATIKERLQNGGLKALDSLAPVPSWQSQAAILYLKETDTPFLKATLNREGQDAIAGVTLELDSAKLLQINRASQNIGAPAGIQPDAKEVWRGFGEIEDLRVAPNGKFALVVHHDAANSDLFDIELASLDAPSPTVRVAQSATGHAAWSPDSKQAIFFTGNRRNDESKWIGTLVSLPVIADDGTVSKTTPDAGALLSTAIDRGTNVAALKDGRYVFLGTEVQLPATAQDLSAVDNLFTFKPGEATTHRVMARLDAESLRSIGSMHVNPAETLAAVGRADGEELDVVNLATGKIDHLSMDSKFDPCWRNDDEVCFTRKTETKAPNQHEREVVLHSMSTGKDRVISEGWPRSAVMGFLIKEPKKP